MRSGSGSGVFHVGGRIVPLAQLVAIAESLVDDELAVVAQGDLHPLQRSRRRAFEVDAVLGAPPAVAGALELVLGSQPARRAAVIPPNPNLTFYPFCVPP